MADELKPIHGKVLAEEKLEFGFDGFKPGTTIVGSDERKGVQPVTLLRGHLVCEKDGLLMTPSGAVSKTLVGYIFQSSDHRHDDNCLCQRYFCPEGHTKRISKRRRCPNCEWVGKAQCFCHENLKVDEWPL